MDYQVKTKPDGRLGWAYYSENGVTLPIEWELSTVGISIYLQSEDEWDAFCEKHGAQWAKNSRDIIMQRVAEGVKKDRGLKGEILIDGSWIHLYRGPGCLSRVQSWFFD